MPRSAQRLADVGIPRGVVYGLSVGAAAYLVVLAYGPAEPLARMILTLLLAVGYAAIVLAVGVFRRRRIQR